MRIRRSPQAKKSIGPIANKGQGILYSKVLAEFEKKAHGRKLRYPEVNHLLSWFFHLNKSEIKILLNELEEAGFLKIVPFHGITLIQEELD